MLPDIEYFNCLIILFLIGSIPTGYLLTKYSGHGDIRKVGSGNIGATNVLRHSGLKLGLLTFLLDFSKGFLPIFLILNNILFTSPQVLTDVYFFLYLIYAAPILGHIFSPWLKFKGGKGVATTFGAFAAPFLYAGSFTILLFLIPLVWLVTVFFTRYVALGSVFSLCFLTIYSSFFIKSYFILFLLITLLIAYKHKDNFERIKNKTEHKISF